MSSSPNLATGKRGASQPKRDAMDCSQGRRSDWMAGHRMTAPPKRSGRSMQQRSVMAPPKDWPAMKHGVPCARVASRASGSYRRRTAQALRTHIRVPLAHCLHKVQHLPHKLAKVGNECSMSVAGAEPLCRRAMRRSAAEDSRADGATHRVVHAVRRKAALCKGCCPMRAAVDMLI